MPGRYVRVWEFLVRRGSEAEFERHYASGGSWVQLFRRGTGHIETLLLKDRARRDRYFTVDRWESELAYRDFRRELAQAYDELDRACEGLTVRETVVGEFDE